MINQCSYHSFTSTPLSQISAPFRSHLNRNKGRPLRLPWPRIHWSPDENNMALKFTCSQCVKVGSVGSVLSFSSLFKRIFSLSSLINQTSVLCVPVLDCLYRDICSNFSFCWQRSKDCVILKLKTISLTVSRVMVAFYLSLKTDFSWLVCLYHLQRIRDITWLELQYNGIVN